MVHTHKLAAVVLAGLLVVGFAGVGATTGLESSQETAGNQTAATVTVSGSGEASAEPDRALVLVAATATANASGAAAERLAANVSDLRATLEEDDRVERVRTTGFQLFQQRENETTYVARQSFEVEVTDVEAAGAVIDLAVGAGATEVDGVAFTLSRERERELRATAIDRAAADARAEAEAVAASTDLTLGGIRSVSTVDRGVGPARETAAADEGTVVDPGPVTVTAGLEVTYNATAD